MFVEKIAGALAAEGAPLAEVKAIAERVVDAARSIGFALTSCTTPMAGRPTFALGPDEIEFGVGIHGEQGIGRRRMATARGLAEAAIDHPLDDLNPDFGAELLMLTNGLGGTPESELYLFTAKPPAPSPNEEPRSSATSSALRHQPRHGRCLDLAPGPRRRAQAPLGRSRHHRGAQPMTETLDAAFAVAWMNAAAAALDNACPLLTELDAARGDADHGVNMQRGFAAIADHLTDDHRPRQATRSSPPPRSSAEPWAAPAARSGPPHCAEPADRSATTPAPSPTRSPEADPGLGRSPSSSVSACALSP